MLTASVATSVAAAYNHVTFQRTHSRTCLTVSAGETSRAAITLIGAITIGAPAVVLTNLGSFCALVYV